jgi:hypothetical protein
LPDETESETKPVARANSSGTRTASARSTFDCPSEFPLREIRVIAKHCSGGIILGFQQFVATAGIWKPGTKEMRRVGVGKAEHFPSPWNHLEAGIIFGLQLPLLIFREEPVRGGVFDEGVTDVFIPSIPDRHLNDAKLEAFREVLLKWWAKVREHYYRVGGHGVS